MKKAVFLDRDGTINQDSGYTFKISDYKLLPGVIKFLKKIYQNNYDLFILTNQSGIGRNLYSKELFTDFMSYMIKDLKSEGVNIKSYYYCPHLRIEKCKCRKPKAGMYLQANNEHGPYDIQKSFAIGDNLRDMQAAKVFNGKIRTILVAPGGVKIEVESMYVDYVVNNLALATKIILSE